MKGEPIDRPKQFRRFRHEGAPADVGRVKLAELTSGLGAVVLGMGLGVLLSRYLAGLGVPVLLIGLALHGSGMYTKHRLEQGGAAQPWWATALYWLCWALLAALVGYLILRPFRSEH